PNLADKNPEKVAELQQRIESLAREGGQPLLMKEVKGVACAYGVCRHTDSLPSCVFLSTSSDLPATA
ncbi:MAG: hypothetical protein ACM35E_12550, partial [Deltaproteobacteria bacterium]